MKRRPLFYLLLLAYLFGCEPAIKYPPGGYDYLKDMPESDSDYYFLPIRKQIPLVDSMRYANEKYFYRSFSEPNLSLRPVGEDVFRLCVEGFKIKEVVISLTKKGLLVKQTKEDNEGSIYPAENYEQLTEIEKQHYFFLKKFFPFGKRTYTHGRQLYIDSVIQSDARLLDVNYYRYLINKVIDKEVPAFEYTSKTIPLSVAQFRALADSINSSGYWQLQYHPESLEEVTDDWGFWLEANTKHKYNMVSSGTAKTKGTSKLKKVCQQIINYAQLGKEYNMGNQDEEK
ncbi:MAG: hypothetical protein QM726_26230 [Chitinophagaceae bacterium]